EELLLTGGEIRKSHPVRKCGVAHVVIWWIFVSLARVEIDFGLLRFCDTTVDSLVPHQPLNAGLPGLDDSDAVPRGPFAVDIQIEWFRKIKATHVRIEYGRPPIANLFSFSINGEVRRWSTSNWYLP